MAVTFTKLGLKKNQEIKTIVLNEQSVEVKQYLPMNDKLDLMGKVLTDSQDENNFANPIKIEIGARVGYLYGHHCESVENLYNGQFQNK